jgi:hypothetical protein
MGDFYEKNAVSLDLIAGLYYFSSCQTKVLIISVYTYLFFPSVIL